MTVELLLDLLHKRNVTDLVTVHERTKESDLGPGCLSKPPLAREKQSGRSPLKIPVEMDHNVLRVGRLRPDKKNILLPIVTVPVHLTRGWNIQNIVVVL